MRSLAETALGIPKWLVWTLVLALAVPCVSGRCRSLDVLV